MDLDQEYVLEFYVDSLSCKNSSVRSSPIVVSLLGCPDITLNAKSATICKITYGKGKRLKIPHTYLTDLRAIFSLIYGFGDQSVRASCTLDFYKLADTNFTEPVPQVYSVEAGMNNIEGDPFGILKMNFQLFPLRELQQSSLALQRKATSRISVRAQPHSAKVTHDISPRDSTSVKQPSSSRSSAGASIHERYIARNEMWLGNHCSTKAEGTLRTPRVASRFSSSRSVSRYI